MAKYRTVKFIIGLAGPFVLGLIVSATFFNYGSNEEQFTQSLKPFENYEYFTKKWTFDPTITKVGPYGETGSKKTFVELGLDKFSHEDWRNLQIKITFGSDKLETGERINIGAPNYKPPKNGQSGVGETNQFNWDRNNIVLEVNCRSSFARKDFCNAWRDSNPIDKVELSVNPNNSAQVNIAEIEIQVFGKKTN